MHHIGYYQSILQTPPRAIVVTSGRRQNNTALTETLSKGNDNCIERINQSSIRRLGTTGRSARQAA